MPRPIQALIHTSAFSHNLKRVRHAAPHSKVWAVVKANAYGHGIERTFLALGMADGFAVVDLDEAVRIRQLGWAGPLLLLQGFYELGDLIAISEYRLSVVIHSLEQISLLETASLATSIDVYLKCNSGMNRLGVPVPLFAQAHARLRALHFVRGITLMTHFACADKPEGVAEQSAAFERATKNLDGARSLCNSAGLLLHPDTQADWVRPGLMLYGASPLTHQTAAQLNLQAAMTLRSRLVSVQNLQAGEKVGYGFTFTAPHAMRIGVVACGYADGYPRHANNGTPVLVEGVRCPLVGRVSMDMLTVDLSSVPQAQPGSSVELWGTQLPIDEVAHHADTVAYELMCALAPRVPVQVL